MALSSFKLISEKLVKPSFSTPPSLTNYKLSLLDQLATKKFMPMAFFYPNNPNSNTTQTSSLLLEESLSKTLSYYYPFAGRLTDNISINCNDMGVTFLEARIKSPMSESFANTAQDNMIFPRGLPWGDGHPQSSLMVAQLTHFDCGGKALILFVNDWAAIARKSSEKPCPEFIGASVLPPPINDPSVEGQEFPYDPKSVTKRLIFDSKKLTQLKAKATAESHVQNPTGFEVVTALVYKCAMSASMVCSGSFKPSILMSAFNLRALIGSPITQKYVGNLISPFPVLTTNESEINFAQLVSEIRRAKIQQYEKFKGMTTSKLSADTLEMFNRMKVLQAGKNDMDGYGCTSLRKFSAHKIDFGWGRPIRVSLAASPYNNLFTLTDNQNGNGIEAMVTLDEQVMSVFQCDPEILALES